MSVDKVPGVKMANSGAPVREKLTPSAASGAASLAAAVAKQRKERAAELAAAQEEARQKGQSRPAMPARAAAGSSSQQQHLRLDGLLGGLDAKIDGQHLAKDVVSRALRRRSMRLDDSERPLRLLFAGPSGVGKTAMATALCEALLGSCVPDRNFKRFNLSEFSHPSKFNRLTGGDPNYVGYKEGGELTNFIRTAEERRKTRRSGVEHTSCVLLLDEVDRAAEGLLTFLMNFLDQGQLTSGAGEMVDARKAVVLMTTNCGQSTPGRRAVVERQLASVQHRVSDGQGERASLDGWSEPLIAHTIAHWDDDTGGRSTRDFIEENVVEAIADALDTATAAEDAKLAADERLSLMLDVETDAATAIQRVVCRSAGATGAPADPAYPRAAVPVEEGDEDEEDVSMWQEKRSSWSRTV